MLSGPLIKADLDSQLCQTGKILAGVHGSYVCSASLKNHTLGILGWNTQREAAAYVFLKSSLMCISDWKFSLWSLHKKYFSRGICSILSDVWYLGKMKGKKITDYNRILGHLILLEMHVEKITLNESHWAVHIFGKIYFKDGFNWQAYHYLKKNEKHMKPDIFVELLSVNS